MNLCRCSPMRNPPVTLHHSAECEWIGMAARTDFNVDGFGVADTRLYDALGPIGRGLQTLLICKR
jgi:hypothetical protein